MNQDQPFFAIFSQHYEGLQFFKWHDQLAFIALIRKVFHCLLKTMTKIAQAEADVFDMTVRFPKA